MEADPLNRSSLGGDPRCIARAVVNVFLKLGSGVVAPRGPGVVQTTQIKIAP
jgi:hypothetical protein